MIHNILLTVCPAVTWVWVLRMAQVLNQALSQVQESGLSVMSKTRNLETHAAFVS